MGTEVELKLQVPPAARERLRAAVATAGVQRTPLRAAYFDTAGQRLAAAGFALRLRQEGPRWVQTLKGRGDGVMARLEHEVPLSLPPMARATLDPARHAGTPAGDALARLLADGAPLEERYRTDIVRLHRVLRSGGARVEIAFDEGEIAAGTRRTAVCEIEFELVTGPAAALPLLAARWAQRFGLVLDVRTKSERGHRLALGLQQVPAVRVAAPRRATPARQVQHALAQVLPNVAEVFGGTATPAHVRGVQGGLVRLRRALQKAGDPAGQALALRLAAPPAAPSAFSVSMLEVLAWALISR